MNPILSMLNSTNKQTQPQVSKSPQSSGNTLKDFAAFKKSMEGKDPKAIVDGLRSSGKMSEKQYQDLLTRAKSLESLLK